MRRQLLKVTCCDSARPCVEPLSVTSILKLSVRFGAGSPRSKICAMTSSRESKASPSILGCSGATASRMNLALRGLLVDALKNHAGNKRDGDAAAAPPGMNIRSVAQLRIVDIVRAFAGNILLGNEAGSPYRLRVIHVGRWKQLAYKRQRTRVAASCLGATSGITSHNQRDAP